jgi:hypothetical protein
VDEMIKEDPNILVLCLKAPKKETVKNLVWSWGYANPLIAKPRKAKREINRYPLSQFPDYSRMESLIEATELFYEEFYSLAEDLVIKYPNNFKVINSEDGIPEALYSLNLIKKKNWKASVDREIYTTNLNGGLGNILFQIAEALIFAREHGYPTPEFGYWNEDAEFRFPKHYGPDREFGGHEVELAEFNSTFRNLRIERFKRVGFNTHFQVSNMFNFAHFGITNPILLETASQERIDAIALHLRFGGLNADISSIPKIRSSFYTKVFRKIPSDVPVRIYSDNLVAAKKWSDRFSKKLGREMIIVQCSAIATLVEMTRCNYHVLHSSTFSFWSAYLDPTQPNSNVYYPKEFNKLHGSRMIPFNEWTCL